VFVFLASAIHADTRLGTVVTSLEDLRVSGGVFGIIKDRSSEMLGNRWVGVIGANESTLSFDFFVWSVGLVWGGRANAGVGSLEVSVGIVSSGCGFREVAPEVFKVRAKFFDGKGFGDLA
jgi:hypothetical protein